MPRYGIVNVRMVITEEKILSNIEKVQRLINPDSKKQIIELEDNSYFKDLVEAIKTYLIEYPNKKNFPKTVYDAAYKLVEYATIQFEKNTKQIESLIKQREYNIKSASILKQVLAIITSGDLKWKQAVASVRNRFSNDVIQALLFIGDCQIKDSEQYESTLKLINARVANLQANLHIEIDMERIEDRSKALSYIGIEIADALKLIPAPVDDELIHSVKKAKENVEQVGVLPMTSEIEQNAPRQRQVSVMNQPVRNQVNMQINNSVNQMPKQNNFVQVPISQKETKDIANNAFVNTNINYANNQQMSYARPVQFMNNQNAQTNQFNNQQKFNNFNNDPINTQNVQSQNNYNQNYNQNNEQVVVKSSLWNKIKNSKFVRAVKYAFKIRITLQLPEGITESQQQK